MRLHKIALGALTGAMFAFGGAAQAGIIVTPGNTGSLDDDNVLFNACTGNTTTGTTIQGCFNGQPTTFVNISSDEEITGTTAGGQAKVLATDGGFSELTISLASGNTFGSLILNILIPNGTDDALVAFTGVPGGASNPASFALGNGSNFFTITPDQDGPFTSVTLNTTTDIVVEVRQIRLGDISGGGGGGGNPTPVPEPASLALLGAGLLGLGAMSRRRRRVA